MLEESYWEKKERQEAEANIDFDLDELEEVSHELEKQFWVDFRKENIWNEY